MAFRTDARPSCGVPCGKPFRSASTPKRLAGVSAAASHGWLASPWVWAACLGLGLAARLAQFLRGPSYWYDEAYLLLNVFQRGYGALLGRIDHEQVMPPLFLWLLRATYRLAGGGE